MNSKDRLIEIDALRGIAALMVVCYHYSTRYDELFGHQPALPAHAEWGKDGVYLFFVISGFVIFMTLERTRRASDFLVSRFSRLYPAYWGAMLITTAAVWLGGLDDRKVDLKAFIENVVMFQGLFRVPQIDGVYWTLTVELSFYFCMLLLFLTKQLKHMAWILFLWLGLKWAWALAPLPSLIGNIFVDKYIPFFAIGICFYGIFTENIATGLSLAIAAAAIVTEFALDGVELGVVAIAVTAIFALLITRKMRWLRAPAFEWLGGISYTLYLLHQNVGYAVIRALESRHMFPVLAIAAALGVSILLAWILSVLIERPAMRLIRRRYGAPQSSVAARAAVEI